MNAKELRQKNIHELQSLLETQKKDLQKLMSDLLQRKDKNVKKARVAREDIARVNTVINEKKIIEEVKDMGRKSK